MLKNFVYPFTESIKVTAIRRFATKKLPKVDKKLQAAAESLAARGFLRPSKPYDPPSDAEQKVLSICASNGLNADFDTTFQELDKKFAILNACFQQLNYSVPNSLIHTIVSVGDLVAFYKTPVHTKSPFDALKNMDLPKNLHVQHDYLRFHPDTDTLFNGKSAFPKQSCIVTGLKARKKYQGFTAKRSWP